MLEAGDVFAGYSVERLLGAGGMGEVYAARHPRLPRSDALKVLPAAFAADPQFRARFEREADLAAALSHPAVVKVYDRGEDDGHLWIAMQLVDGTDLGRRLEQTGPLTPAQVAFAITPIADALDRAHSRGLIHRDVKPANILLSADGDILLADFGIARTTASNSDLTATGATIGTLNYASPEQLRGEDLGGRSDQYALACTAFHLLTGRPPFQAGNSATVIARHLTEPFPAARPLRPELPPPVDQVLARAAAKNPADRFGSCGEFAAALAAVLALPPAPISPGAVLPPRVQPSGPARVPTPAPAPASGPVPRPQLGPIAPPSGPVPPPGSGPVSPVGAAAQATYVPPPAPASPPGGSGRKAALVVGAVAAVLVLVAAGFFVFRGGDGEDSGVGIGENASQEAKDLRLDEVSPYLTSLEDKPDAEPWRYRPRDPDDEGTVIGVGKDAILVARSDYDRGSRYFIDFADKETGEVIRTIDQPGGSGTCAVDDAGTLLACKTSYDYYVLDLTAPNARAAAVAGDNALAVVGDTIVTVEYHSAYSSSSGSTYTYRGFDRDGREKWKHADTTSGYASHADLGGENIGFVRTTGEAPYQTHEYVVIRIGDGEAVQTMELTERDGYVDTPMFAPFTGGYSLANDAGVTFYDTDGHELSKGDTADRWITLPDTRGVIALPAPALPVFQNRTDTLAVFNPATGHTLWTTKIPRELRKSAGPVIPTGRSVMMRFGSSPAAGNDRGDVLWFDCATGAGGQAGDSTGMTALGTDGTRLAALTTNGIKVFDPDGSVRWSLDLGSTYSPVVVSGGYVFLGSRRII